MDDLPIVSACQHNLAQFVLLFKKFYQRDFLFLTERGGNLVENKGWLWKTRRRSGNVAENKGGYVTKAGMLVKTKG